jgi:hypothetical protein
VQSVKRQKTRFLALIFQPFGGIQPILYEGKGVAVFLVKASEGQHLAH